MVTVVVAIISALEIIISIILTNIQIKKLNNNEQIQKTKRLKYLSRFFFIWSEINNIIYYFLIFFSEI